MKRLLLFVVPALLLLAITVNSAEKGVIVSGSNSDPVSLDPAEVWDDTASIYINGIFETLTNVDLSTGRVLPSLALSWRSENSGKKWIFKLRRDVVFHDSSKMDANSVVFSFRRIYDKKSKFRYYEFPLFDEIFFALENVKKIDKFTVEFILKEPIAAFPLMLSVDCASIVSPEAVKKYGAEFRIHPVGTGPFYLGLWKKDKRIDLIRNENYWGKRPTYKKYSSLIIKNFNHMLNLFKNRTIDIMFSYSISKMPMLRGLNWVGRAYSKNLSINFIAFNLNHRLFRKKEFRKALNFLWNRNFIKMVYQDYVSPVCSIIPEGLPGYSDRNLYSFSVKKAKEIIKKIKKNKPGDLKLNFIIFEDSELSLNLISLFKRSLKSAGIDLKIIRVDTEKKYNDMIIRGIYDMTFSGWIADYPDSDSFLRPLFSKKLASMGFANFSAWKNKKILKLIEETRKQQNPKKRESGYSRINRLIMENALCIPVYQDKSLVIYNKRISNLKVSDFGVLNLTLLKEK